MWAREKKHVWDGSKTVVKTVIFGIGIIGKEMVSKLIEIGKAPDYLVDNNPNLWNTEYKGIPIVSVEEIKQVGPVQIIIACKKYEEIKSQLLREGIPQEDILECYTKEGFQEQVKKRYVVKKRKEHPILFDLQHGLVLGGVEAWVFQITKEFQKKGIPIKYLTTNLNPPVVSVGETTVMMFDYQKEQIQRNQIRECVWEIIKELPCTVVCNFPFQIFEAACMVKEMYPELVNLVGVIHSDDEIYYNAYQKNEEKLDRIFVISSKIEETILERGVAKQKVCQMQWMVSCKETLERKYSKQGEALRIGYAGRITTELKRVDRLILLAISLKKKGILFVIELAGIGPYQEQLQTEIKEKGLEEEIKWAGYLSREKIPEFWERQDIMVSCSDREGHSISQEEAMASGAVPVVFDTSGARDNVEDGYHGYVLPVGDMAAMAEKIEVLYQNRELLEKMGHRSYCAIKEKEKQTDTMQVWEGVLLKRKESIGEEK